MTSGTSRGRFAFLAGLFAVCLGSLTACSGPRPLARQLTEVNVTTVGSPRTTSGALAFDTVTLEVVDGQGGVVHFDDVTANPAGAQRQFVLTPDQAHVTLYLPRNAAYTFRASAHDRLGHFLAYGESRRTVVMGGDNAIAVGLRSLLGGARLERRLPVHALLPGQTVDLVLTVTPTERPDLTVPPTDYAASYEAHNATSLQASERGLRLRAGERSGGDLQVVATATGLRLEQGNVAPGSVTAAIRIPFHSGVAIDLENPAVTTLAFDATQQIFTGVADDDLGVARLEVFDGPVLLATSDLDTVATGSVPEVLFPGGGTAFVTWLSLSPGAHELTIYASDFSGNQGEAVHQVVVP